MARAPRVIYCDEAHRKCQDSRRLNVSKSSTHCLVLLPRMLCFDFKVGTKNLVLDIVPDSGMVSVMSVDLSQATVLE